MRQVQTSHRNLSLVVIFAILILTLVASSWLVSAHIGAQEQNQGKVIEQTSFRGTPVVELVEQKTAKLKVRLGEKFNNGDDWLQGFTFRLKNVSNKPINYIEVWLDFPETKATGSIMAFPLKYGQSPWLQSAASNALPIMPGDIVDIPISDAVYAALRGFVEKRHAVKNLNKVQLRISFVGFTDGSAWDSGQFVRPDPQNPRRYVPIEDNPQGAALNRVSFT
jgi:hypothetical protein